MWQSLKDIILIYNYVAPSMVIMAKIWFYFGILKEVLIIYEGGVKYSLTQLLAFHWDMFGRWKVGGWTRIYKIYMQSGQAALSYDHS